MFVKNLTDREFSYFSTFVEIKFPSNRTVFVDDTVVSASILKETFGSKILIMSPNQEKAEVRIIIDTSKQELQNLQDSKESSTVKEDKEIEDDVDRMIQAALEEAKAVTEAEIKKEVKLAESEVKEETEEKPKKKRKRRSVKK